MYVKPKRPIIPGLRGVLVKDTMASTPSAFAASSSTTFSGLPHAASIDGSTQLKLRGSLLIWPNCHTASYVQPMHIDCKINPRERCK